MTYRTDSREQCRTCRAPLAAGEGVFTKNGDLLCRNCHSRVVVHETAQRIAESAAPAWAPDRPQTTSGYLALLPVAGFMLWCLLQLASHLGGGGKSCSELGCLDLVLVPMLGIVVSIPCAIFAVMRVPADARRRVAFAAFGATLAMLGSCIAATS